MAEPVIVTIPHRLGKDEATRRLKTGFGNARATLGEKFMVLKDDWKGDHLDFRASLLGQTTTGTVDVGEDSVRLEVQLPWVLAMLANKAKALVEKQGQLMLEKPSKKPTRSA
jgi:hypothetical protein